MDWIDLAQDRDRRRALLNAAMNHWVPKHEGQLLTSSGPKGLSRRTPLHTVTADSHIACRADAVSLPCRAAKGLECVFPI